MKKILIFLTVIIMPGILLSQQTYRLSDGTYISQQLIDIPAMLIFVWILSASILAIIRWNLDYRLKTKMLEKGVTDKVAAEMLQRATGAKSEAIRWFLILTGVAVGLFIVKITMPIGIHSIAILVFCVALSFLAYYYFIKRTIENQKSSI